MREIKIPSTNKKDKLNVYIWEPEGEIKAIVQISHGMIDYVKRYEEFAEYLCARGILVIGNDHLGHGKTAACDEDLGYFGAEKSATVVDDLHEITKYAKETFSKNVPYILFGHSMGSFMARRYLMTYGEELDGAIICGTGSQPGIVLTIGKLVSGITKLFKGERHRSKFITGVAFGSYNKRINNPKTGNDWLSRDEENVALYCKDKFCSFMFTVNGYQTLFGVIAFIQKKSNIAKLRKDLPMFLIAGEEDPVGNFGKAVTGVYECYKNHGVADIDIKLYPEDRHEILREVDKEIVFEDVYNWIDAHVLSKK